jgi:hypothetical protein
VGRLGKECERVREVAACSLDQRKASENPERDEKPALADFVGVTMGAEAVSAVPMPMPMPMRSMRGMARVGMIAVTLVRVRHELGSPDSDCILETL